MLTILMASLQIRHLGRTNKPPEALGLEGTITILDTLLRQFGTNFIFLCRRKSSIQDPPFQTILTLSLAAVIHRVDRICSYSGGRNFKAFLMFNPNLLTAHRL